jgi:redox-sensitive bicupin YhaK (pirin superfamily)
MTPSFILRPSSARGETNIGWLRSKHSFAFGEYWDPRWQGFGRLRVINDDIVAPGMGFDTHGHKDMEIISVVLEGKLAHKDSLGSEAILPAGSIQIMSAGTGIRHSEYNPSKTESVHFIQIWIEPLTRGTKPFYKEAFLEDAATLRERVLIGEGGVSAIGQDASVSVLNLNSSVSPIKKRLIAGRGHWVHVIDGTLQIEKNSLSSGDGIGVISGEYEITGEGRALFFDVPYDS